MRYYLIVVSKSEQTTIYEFDSWKDRNQVFEIVHRTTSTDVFLGIDVDEHGVVTIAKDTDFCSGPGLEMARAWWKAAKSTSMNNPHIGSSFDEFLEDEGILAEVEAAAVKRVAWQIMWTSLAADALLTAIEIYSEEVWKASWMENVEFEIWRHVLENSNVQPWLTFHALAIAADGWWMWDANTPDNRRFVPMQEWLAIYDAAKEES